MEDHSSYGSALVDAAMNGAEEFVNYPERATTRVWHGFVPDHYARHWHGDVEIIMTLKGCVRVTVGEDPFRVKEGEVLIIPAGQSHSLTMGQDCERYLYQFQFQFQYQFPPLVYYQRLFLSFPFHRHHIRHDVLLFL